MSMKIRQFQIDVLGKINLILKRRLDKLIDLQLEARRKLKIQELPPGGIVIWERYD